MPVLKGSISTPYIKTQGTTSLHIPGKANIRAFTQDTFRLNILQKKQLLSLEHSGYLSHPIQTGYAALIKRRFRSDRSALGYIKSTNMEYGKK